MKKGVLSGIVLVFSLMVLFSLFLSGVVSADCYAEMGCTSVGTCGIVHSSCTACHQKTYCQDYDCKNSAGIPAYCKKVYTGTDFSCTSGCTPSCSGYDLYVNGTWGECDSSGTQTLVSTCTETGTCPGGCTVGTIINYTKSCSVLINPYWATIKQPNINISSMDLGDTVLMRMPGINLESKILEYNVYVKSGVVWWNPATWFGLSKSWDSMATYSGTAYEPIQINSSSNHKFDVFIQGISGSTKESPELTIHAYNNSMPVAQIISPLDNSNWAVNSPTVFIQSSYDEDDLLEITWDFGDGTNYTVYNYSQALTPGLGNTQHAYTALGVYTVTFTAKEMPTRTNPQSVVVKRTIYVFKEGVNVFPIITSPVKGVQYGNFVNFDASQSFVANCSANLVGYNFTAGNLQCKYLHAPGTIDVASGHNLSVAWNIYSGINGALSSKMGNWQTNYSQVVEFTNYFANADTHEAVLMLDYN